MDSPVRTLRGLLVTEFIFTSFSPFFQRTVSSAGLWISFMTMNLLHDYELPSWLWTSFMTLNILQDYQHSAWLWASCMAMNLLHDYKPPSWLWTSFMTMNLLHDWISYIVLDLNKHLSYSNTCFISDKCEWSQE